MATFVTVFFISYQLPVALRKPWRVKGVFAGEGDIRTEVMWGAVKKGPEDQVWWCMPLIQQVGFCKSQATLICPVSSRETL